MEAFHRDMPRLVDTTSASNFVLPPAREYLSDKIRFLGYLDDEWLRGRANYQRILGLSISSLQAAIRTGAMTCNQAPTCRVELTVTGNTRVSLTLDLAIQPMAGLMNTANYFPMDVANGGGVGSFSFKLYLTSEYRIRQETGLILAPKVLESRVSGQLPPGDVDSTWIQRLSGCGGGVSGGPLRFSGPMHGTWSDP